MKYIVSSYCQVIWSEEVSSVTQASNFNSAIIHQPAYNNKTVMSQPEELMFKAVDENNVDKVIELINQGANFSACTNSGRTVLGRAVQLGYKGCIEAILNINKIKKEDKSEGNLPTYKCDVNQSDYYDRTPLHYAAEHGRQDILELLLQAGCRVDVADKENITPLHIAAGRGHLEFAALLLKTGCQVNRKTSDKASALHVAASRGNTRIVELLLEHGGKVDALDSSDRTPLLLAVNRGNYEAVRILLKYGARVNIEEIHGYTPLAEAVWQKDEEMVQILLLAGAKVTKLHFLIHYCVTYKRYRLTQLLLKNCGGVINIRDDNGDAPLHLACGLGDISIVNLLLENSANPNCANGLNGATPLHEAVNSINDCDYLIFQSIITKLLEHKCKLSMNSFTPGDYPLYRAIVLEKFKIAELLIQYGCDVNKGHVYTCNIDNLCLARRKNNMYIAKMLVYAGFDMTKTTWLEILPSDIGHNYSVSSLIGWLIYVKSNPLNLSDLCRIVLRRSFGEQVHNKLSKLPLPTRLKQYLLLEIL